MKRLTDNTYEPGIIYELRCCLDNEWYPFYVGETYNQRQRIQQHQSAARSAQNHSTLVYRFIHDELDAHGIAWDLFPVAVYGSEGPTDQEDEHMMMLLRAGSRLMNEKKGNANWMINRIRQAEDMVKRGITSYKRYREIITLELATERARTKQEFWIESDPRRQQANDIMAQVRQRVNEQAEIRAEKLSKKQQRALKQEAAVKAARAQQQEQWERDGYKNNFVALFERTKK